MKLLEIYRKCRKHNINKLCRTEFSAFAAEKNTSQGSMAVGYAVERDEVRGSVTAENSAAVVSSVGHDMGLAEVRAAESSAVCGVTASEHTRRGEERGSGGSTVAARVVCCICTLVLLLSACTGIRALGVDAELYDRILRLHVIADSDSDADQAVKLKVRDAVLELLGDEMEASPDLEQARSAAERLMPEAERVARQVLRENGFSYGAAVTLGYEYYPTRDYGSFSLPAGRYLSYRIVLGSGEGHNWWCVLFPALCTAPAEQQEDEFVAAGFTPGQIGVLSGKKSPKYAVRFRLLELLGELGEKLK